MNLRVPQNAGNLLTSSETISVSRKIILLHGVVYIERFMTCGHYSRRWLLKSSWSKS